MKDAVWLQRHLLIAWNRKIGKGLAVRLFAKIQNPFVPREVSPRLRGECDEVVPLPPPDSYRSISACRDDPVAVRGNRQANDGFVMQNELTGGWVSIGKVPNPDCAVATPPVTTQRLSGLIAAACFVLSRFISGRITPHAGERGGRPLLLPVPWQ